MTEYEEQLEQLRQQIVEFADNDGEYGWLPVGKFRFPKRALIHHVFGNMPPLKDLLPSYTAFSPVGLKLPLDNQFHSDLWIGAGFDLSDTYNRGSNETEALHEAVFLIEEEMKELVTFDFTILANNLKNDGSIRDTVITVHVYQYDGPLEKNQWSNTHIDCAEKPTKWWNHKRGIVVPHAGMEYDLAVRNAEVIITEVGGPLAHLAIVSREKGKLLIRVPDAVKRFPRFSKLSIDLNNLTLTPQ